MSDPIPALAARRDRIVELIADLGDMRPGSLSSRSRPCGKPDCQCRSPGGKPHGPYWSITFKLNGKTRNRSLRPDQVHTAPPADCQLPPLPGPVRRTGRSQRAALPGPPRPAQRRRRAGEKKGAYIQS